ncbi:hypothetical protein DVA86_12435 [Streptomyces armeniacus]|uniref:Repetin n=1 Tax=Streptomyces armeniacus TaxID=83291 RepID=A0A345Y070_9ACTN|nr:hypothetical protein DVA86_12435 [Streptomyces armeniacus]
MLLVAAAGSAAAADKAPLDAPRKAAGGGVAEPRLTGTAKLHRTAGDVIHFSFDAHGGGIDTRGTFRFSHYVEGEGSYAQGRMDCLVSGGPVTVATGVVTKSDLPGLKGKRVGFSVTNDGQRLGYSWAATSDPRSAKDLPQCVSSAPYERVERGGFDVVPFEPEL